MVSIPLLMPQLGESIAEATLVRLLVNSGDVVASGQEIFEVETNKAVMTVASPCAGRTSAFRLRDSFPTPTIIH